MYLERYVAKLLPGSNRDFKWGILDCRFDRFVERQRDGIYATIPLAFRNKEAAEYEARKRNLTMPMADA